MKLLTFSTSDDDKPRLGALIGGVVVDLLVAAQTDRKQPSGQLPATMLELIYAGPPAWAYVRDLIANNKGANAPALNLSGSAPLGRRLENVVLHPPLSRPLSLRDFYAFEGHVKTAFANLGRDVPEEWYDFPVFYYCNASTIFGPQEAIPCPAYTQALDYELEIGCIIGKPGVNIKPEQAEEYIFGYTILNDWSARDVQRQEMKVGLGPAKGKDFATSIGPWIVTPDELTEWATGRPGVYDLGMTARVNGEDRSCGNWKDIHYSFGEMIARASQDVYLLPGEVLGSGTVGTGCLLELTHGQGPWLQPGDLVELEIEQMGVLANQVYQMESETA